MKTKMKLNFSATLAMLAAASLSAATSATIATNATPVDAMTALFGDPVIAKGSGAEVKRSQLAEVIPPIKAKAIAQGQTSSQEPLTQVKHILLLAVDPSSRTRLADDQVKAKRKQIDDLLKRVGAGEDFAALARQYSEDPGSKQNGGELPAFPRGEMVPEFEAAAFAM